MERSIAAAPLRQKQRGFAPFPSGELEIILRRMLAFTFDWYVGNVILKGILLLPAKAGILPESLLLVPYYYFFLRSNYVLIFRCFPVVILASNAWHADHEN